MCACVCGRPWCVCVLLITEDVFFSLTQTFIFQELAMAREQDARAEGRDREDRAYSRSDQLHSKMMSSQQQHAKNMSKLFKTTQKNASKQSKMVAEVSCTAVSKYFKLVANYNSTRSFM